jgi:hypothetical protein
MNYSAIQMNSNHLPCWAPEEKEWAWKRTWLIDSKATVTNHQWHKHGGLKGHVKISGLTDGWWKSMKRGTENKHIPRSPGL